MNKGFPIMLDLAQCHCVVIGGGKAAYRKVKALVEARAAVQVISPVVYDPIEEWVRSGAVTLIRRAYAGPEDLRGARLVFAATDSKEVNEQVAEDAKSLGILVNDVGNPARSEFILPSVLRRGSLVVTVSTSGASPALAVKLRDELAGKFGAEYETYVDFLAEVRAVTLQKVRDPDRRAEIFHQALKFDILELIREGRFESFREKWLAEIDGINTV